MCYGCKQEKVILPLCCERPDLDEMLVWACPKEEVKQSKRPTNQPVKLLDSAPKLESGLGGKCGSGSDKKQNCHSQQKITTCQLAKNHPSRGVLEAKSTIWVWVGDRETFIQQDHLQVHRSQLRGGREFLGLVLLGYLSLVSIRFLESLTLVLVVILTRRSQTTSHSQAKFSSVNLETSALATGCHF